jgi:hypothetical protein
LPTGFLLPLSRKFLLLAVSPEHTVKSESLGALPVNRPQPHARLAKQVRSAHGTGMLPRAGAVW